MSETSSPWGTPLPALADQLKLLLASGDMSDVQFTVGRQYGAVKTFSAHKFVLSLGSDVLHTMFHGSEPERGDIPIDIPEILPDAFTNLLQYLYTRSVDENLTSDNVFETMHCADKYNLPQLMELCFKFVNSQLNAGNCLLFLEKAMSSAQECSAGFVEKCLTVVNAHCQDVLRSDQFTLIGRDTLEMIRQRSSLSASEWEIYTAVEKWAAANCLRGKLDPSPANRRAVLGNALFLVRFPLLTDAELADGPLKSRLLLDSELLDIFQFRHAADNKPQLPFPTEPRRGSLLRIPNGYTEFLFNEEVFVDVLLFCDYWWPFKIAGVRGGDFLVTRDDGEPVVQRAPCKIVRASEILKKNQKIKAFSGSGYRECIYGGRRTDNLHCLFFENTSRSELVCPFENLLISRVQVAAWKSSAAQSNG
ncbi:BTB/POZ domain-containing protein 6-like [Paramacrobiotus metropolitanus]|uniref:BTB/POZ domain-containing protein 6-like n=1 Tax=Paramacrobiotus metropolitanus TaxID=2943436 RepID=UPI00244593EB|nr:BTB/POZ domain-containing protein 6-like [Paramacrobiotus metropolitanus]XP_055357158.1 BTB/POZ domain-containing protein 6-like [Paramacrobiotus metropolitanus]